MRYCRTVVRAPDNGGVSTSDDFSEPSKLSTALLQPSPSLYLLSIRYRMHCICYQCRITRISHTVLLSLQTGVRNVPDKMASNIPLGTYAV